MLFNSVHFLIFFPIVWLLYYALPFRFRKYLLLAASYYFYMCWKPEFIVLILASTAANYGFVLLFDRVSERTRKALFVLSLVFNLGMLFVFKYANFAGQTVTALCAAFSIPFSAPVLNIVLPVGISFYTFQTMSYTIDVYRGRMEVERDFVMFALFVSFFPQLVAGPIEKATNLLPQLKVEHPFSYDNVTGGLKLMVWGFFKKLVIADQLSLLFVDPVYGNLELYRGGALIIATVAFSIQIYCDFSGYSDIARGCARTMGIDLMVNFKAPYFSKSVSEFWRRWHVSLGGWLREYVYIPLGGNRKGLAKKLLFCTITFVLSGLWHGAGWNYVLWGLIHAMFLNADSLITNMRKRKGLYPVKGNWLTDGLKCLWTFILCCLARVFFRAETISDAVWIFRNCFYGLSEPLNYLHDAFGSLYPGAWTTVSLTFALILLGVYDAKLYKCGDDRAGLIASVSALPMIPRWCIYVLFVLMLLLLIPKESAAPFVYFQF